MSAESGRAPSSSLAPPTRRVRRPPIRVPIDDVPRGSLVNDDVDAVEAAADSIDVAVHVSVHPPAHVSVHPPAPSIHPEFDDTISVHPAEGSEPPHTVAIPVARTPSVPSPSAADATEELDAMLESDDADTETISIPPDEELTAHAVLAVAADAYAVDDESDAAMLEDAEDSSEEGELEEMEADDFVEEAKHSTAARLSLPPAMPPPSALPKPPATPAAAPAGKPPAAPAAQAGPPPAPPQPQKKWRNWFETFFNDDYLRTVLQPSAKSVTRQCDFIEKVLSLPPGAHVLDVGCGLGLYSNELARRGYHVVGIDSSKAMITRANEDAKDYGVDVQYVTGDMREMTFDVAFDAVLCWGTTFGYFDEEVNRRVLARMRDALREGGKLLLDVVNRDFVIRSQPNLVWFEGDGCVCMEETQLNASTSTLEVSRNVMLDEGRQRETHYAVRLYALHELTRELEQIGMRVVQVSGAIATPGVFFGGDAPRIIAVAEQKGGPSRTPPPARMSVPPGVI